MPDPRPRLPDDVLSRRDRLPVKPAPVVLTGRRVELRPLELPSDLAALHAVSNGTPFSLGARTSDAYDPEARIWRYLSGGPFATAVELGAWLAIQDAALDGRPFTVRDRATGTPIGAANFMASSPRHLKVELGAIWYGPIAQRTGAAVEAIFLMLEHAFAIGYRRVEWKCDALNERSRGAALAYGFLFEGVQQGHMIIKDRHRDTAWFRILEDEWPRTRQALAARAGAPTM